MDATSRRRSEPNEITIENEFASVLLRVEAVGNGARLVIVDVKTGYSLVLDPLQVESSIWAGEERLDAFVDPVMRWGAAE